MPTLQGLDKYKVSGSGGSNIKSTQRGVASYTGRTILDITISSVDLTKSIVKVSQIHGFDTAAKVMIKAELTSPTNLQLTTVTADGGASTITIDWEVIEFNNVKSLQRGSVSSSTTSETVVTISAIDPNKSIIFFSYKHTNAVSTDVSQTFLSAGRIINSTSIGLWNKKAGADFHWQVIEFN